MSLIGDLANVFRSPRAETTPPVPYTSDLGGISRASFLGRSTDPSRRHLDMTTAESTLFSVLDLLASDTSSVKWSLYRKTNTLVRPDQERQPLTDTDHLAAKLWNYPNDFMTGNQLRYTVEWHYDAVGEGWMLGQLDHGVPISFWPVRPDRLMPAVDKTRYLLGWVYTGPGGEQVPLDRDDPSISLMRIWRPHPLDPHRGIGPVQTLMTSLGTSLTAQQWIESFYRNDATPGGMIELGAEEFMDPDEYRKLVSKWNSQHRGVNAAHKVGILEVGTYTPIPVNLRQLQFTEMRHLTRDQVLEAFRVNKNQLGATDDVNRAASLAADDTYARRALKPRVMNWEQLANGDFLKVFGSVGQTVEFCPDSVVPEDEEAENAERNSKATAASTLASSGIWEPDDILATVGLPPMRKLSTPIGGTQ
jgi:HK97 family phage portal protein